MFFSLCRWEVTEEREKNVIVNDLRYFFLEVRRYVQSVIRYFFSF